MSTMVNYDAMVKKLKDLQRQHKLSTEPMDDYFRGMYNGMECMLCVIEDREPEFISRPPTTDGSEGK